MPQLDLVTFPSQIVWLAIIFIAFYAFVSGHFVPLLHKIIQTRVKKTALGQIASSEEAGIESSVIASSENVSSSALDVSFAGLSSCIEETEQLQNSTLNSGSKLQIKSLSNVVSSLQGR
jgi:hypothetical protein